MTTCSMLVDVITRASPLFAIIRSMKLHQLNDEEYRYAFMLCFERYPENERQMCVTRCARWMRYMPVVEAMLKLQPLSKKQWLQLARNMLTAEGMESNNIIACRVIDRAFMEKKVSPETLLKLCIIGMRNRQLYTHIALQGQNDVMPPSAVDIVSVPEDYICVHILFSLAKPFMALIVYRMFRDFHETNSFVPCQLLDFIEPAFPGDLFVFKHGHTVAAGYITGTQADIYVRHMHVSPAEIPDTEPGEVEFIVWQCLWNREYKIAKWLLEHMKIDRNIIMSNATPDNNWKLELVGFDTGIPIKEELPTSLAASSEIYKCVYSDVAAATSIKRLPALLLQGYRLYPSERNIVFTKVGSPEEEVRVFALTTAIKQTFLKLIPQQICVSAWALVCQYVEPDISVLM